MKFYVKSQREAEGLNDLHVPHVIISINFPKRSGEPLANPSANESTYDILFLRFSDVGRYSNEYDDGARMNPRCVPFSREMARQVIGFIEQSKVEHVIIHCLMGASRSASMANALSQFYNSCNVTSWGSMNRLVYNIMLKELMYHHRVRHDNRRSQRITTEIR